MPAIDCRFMIARPGNPQHYVDFDMVSVEHPGLSRDHSRELCQNVACLSVFPTSSRLNMPTSRLGTVKDVALIIVAWCVSVLVVNPARDFPILDDWAFGRTVAHLLGTGQYDPLNWGWMTLVTNVLWGALFCLPDGFSFTALRISTLVPFRDLRHSRAVALLAVMLTGFNPYFSLAHSFMAEALFMALLVWASIFFIRSLRTDSIPQLIAGTALVLAATLPRQLALSVPLLSAQHILLDHALACNPRCTLWPHSQSCCSLPCGILGKNDRRRWQQGGRVVFFRR